MQFVNLVTLYVYIAISRLESVSPGFSFRTKACKFLGLGHWTFQVSALQQLLCESLFYLSMPHFAYQQTMTFVH